MDDTSLSGVFNARDLEFIHAGFETLHIDYLFRETKPPQIRTARKSIHVVGM